MDFSSWNGLFYESNWVGGFFFFLDSPVNAQGNGIFSVFLYLTPFNQFIFTSPDFLNFQRALVEILSNVLSPFSGKEPQQRNA